MSGKSDEFIPYTTELGIPGSSYRLSMGIVNNKWAVRLTKGDEVLDSNVFQDSDLSKIPNSDDITRWVLMVLTIPNLNPHQIMKTVGFVRQQAKRNYDEKGKVKITKEEAASVSLEKPPENRITRPSSLGEVKDDGVVDENSSEAMKASNQAAVSAPPPAKKRNLPQIPSADGAEPEKKAATPPPEKAASHEHKIETSAIEGIKCGSCGSQIRFCPYCGKPL